MKKLLSVICIAALTISTLVGCSDASEHAGNNKESGEYVIGYASKSATTPYWVQLGESIQDAAKEMGVTVKEIGPSKENDVAGQIAIIEDFYS